MKFATQQLLASLFMIALFAACSRPVAYVQPSAREHFTALPAETQPVNFVDVSGAEVTNSPASAIATTPTDQLAQATAALDQVDAMVRNDSKLAADKTVQKRLNRVRTFLAATSAKATTTTSTATNASRKMNLMERMMLKKLDKKISKHLAPANPEKAMAIKGVLAAGAVLVLAGILLLLLTTGTGATIGVVAIIGGLVLLLLGLL